MELKESWHRNEALTVFADTRAGLVAHLLQQRETLVVTVYRLLQSLSTSPFFQLSYAHGPIQHVPLSFSLHLVVQSLLLMRQQQTGSYVSGSPTDGEQCYYTQRRVTLTYSELRKASDM